MGFCAADGGDDAFTDTGDNGLLAGAADQALDVCAHGHAGFGAQLDTVLGDGGNHGSLDDLRGNAHLDCLEDITASQVNGAGFFKGHFNVCPLGGDQGVDDAVHITAGQVVGFQLADGQVQASLVRFDQRVDQTLGLDAADPHTYERADRDVHATGQGRNPQSHGDEVEKDCQGDENDNDNDRNQNGTHRPGIQQVMPWGG